MDTFLLILALLTQTADGVLTCRGLARGGVEVNPVLPQSCAGIIGVKAGMITGALFLPDRARRWMLGGIAAGGAIGVTVTLILREDE